MGTDTASSTCPSVILYDIFEFGLGIRELRLKSQSGPPRESLPSGTRLSWVLRTGWDFSHNWGFELKMPTNKKRRKNQNKTSMAKAMGFFRVSRTLLLCSPFPGPMYRLNLPLIGPDRTWPSKLLWENEIKLNSDCHYSTNINKTHNSTQIMNMKIPRHLSMKIQAQKHDDVKPDNMMKGFYKQLGWWRGSINNSGDEGVL